MSAVLRSEWFRAIPFEQGKNGFWLTRSGAEISRQNGNAMQKQLLIRLVVTALVACPIAVIVAHGTSSIVWTGLVCWVGLYWLWKWGDGRSTTRPFWWTVLRRIIILVAGAVAFIVVMVPVMMILDLCHAETQVSTERNKGTRYG